MAFQSSNPLISFCSEPERTHGRNVMTGEPTRRMHIGCHRHMTTTLLCFAVLGNMFQLIESGVLRTCVTSYGSI
jgi:hypothetical protein